VRRRARASRCASVKDARARAPTVSGEPPTSNVTLRTSSCPDLGEAGESLPRRSSPLRRMSPSSGLAGEGHLASPSASITVPVVPVVQRHGGVVGRASVGICGRVRPVSRTGADATPRSACSALAPALHTTTRLADSMISSRGNRPLRLRFATLWVAVGRPCDAIAEARSWACLSLLNCAAVFFFTGERTRCSSAWR
jgi:hypothetical protein